VRSKKGLNLQKAYSNYNKMTEREFAIKFILKNNISTQMQIKNVSPQEAIGLLEMAKDQIMENIRKGRQNIFDMHGKKDEENKDL